MNQSMNSLKTNKFSIWSVEKEKKFNNTGMKLEKGEREREKKTKL